VARSERGELNNVVRLFLESNFTPLSISLLDSWSQDRLFYNHESQSLELERINTWPPLQYYIEYLPLNALYTWLSTQRITRLRLAKQHDLQVAYFRSYFTSHLTHLEISTVSVRSNHFDRNFWSDRIEPLSNLPSLRHCELSSLTYGFDLGPGDIDSDDLDSDDYDQYDIRLGKYLVLTGHGLFHSEHRAFNLIFADGTDTIKLDGDDTCEKLGNLAYHVGIAEDNKRQTIIDDGSVLDDVVRVIQ
jgi:hypothetical protein